MAFIYSLFVCDLCVNVRVCGCMKTYACGTQLSTLSVSLYCFCLLFWDSLSLKMEFTDFTKTGWTAAPRSPPVSASWMLELWARTGTNRVLGAWAQILMLVWILPTESSPSSYSSKAVPGSSCAWKRNSRVWDAAADRTNGVLHCDWVVRLFSKS